MTRQYFISFALLDGDSIRLGNGILDMPEKITKQDITTIERELKRKHEVDSVTIISFQKI